MREGEAALREDEFIENGKKGPPEEEKRYI